MRDIQPLVAPRSIAVIGASTNPTKSGGVLFHNLVRGNFNGPLYPINPGSPEVMGVKAYPAIAAVPERVDLVYIVLPRNSVEAAIKQCIEAGARAACIVTAGFSEASDRGRMDEARIKEMAAAAGLLLAGPNTIGLVNADVGMMGSFVHFPSWEKGPVSLFTQTGIFTGALMLGVMTSQTQRLPASKSIDVGNKIDVDEIDFLDYVAADPDTKVVGFYIESIARPEVFFEKAARLRQSKPIVILKPGRTGPGSKASLYHTGSMPHDHSRIDALLEQHGIPRAEDEDDFLGALRALAMLPRPKGKRIGIATTSGALGVISTDLATQYGLELSSYHPDTIARMRTILPDWLEPMNPYDFWIGIDVKGPRESHEVGLEAVFADPNTDLLLLTLLAPGNADFAEFGALMKRLRRTYDKPVALVVYGGDAQPRWVSGVEGADIPVYRTTRAGVRALSMLVQATL